MWKLFFVLSSLVAHADEVRLSMPKTNVSVGDTIVMTEYCTPQNVPTTQPGTVIEFTGEQGKTTISTGLAVGSTWTGVRVRKGNESYVLQVMHDEGQDPIALVKSGSFKVNSNLHVMTGCRHTKRFKLCAEEVHSGASSSQGATFQ